MYTRRYPHFVSYHICNSCVFRSNKHHATICSSNSNASLAHSTHTPFKHIWICYIRTHHTWGATSHPKCCCVPFPLHSSALYSKIVCCVYISIYVIHLLRGVRWVADSGAAQPLRDAWMMSMNMPI